MDFGSVLIKIALQNSQQACSLPLDMIRYSIPAFSRHRIRCTLGIAGEFAMKRLSGTVLSLILVTLSASCGWSQPPNQEITISGLKAAVTVRRDERNIPYIEAKSDADLYFVQGYVTAQDRLWQMDLLRRTARGETAEVFGRTTIEEDKRWRKFQFSQLAETSLQNLSPELRAALENYAHGVNAYIATLNKDTLPIEFQILKYQPTPWKPTDTVVIGKILADGLSSSWRKDLFRLSIAALPKEKQADLLNVVTPYDVVLFGKDAAVQTQKANAQSAWRITPSDLRIAEREDALRKTSLERIGFYAEHAAASNNWVISGKRTRDGKPILANDPHLQPIAPNIWYLAHLATPTMRVAGVTFPGVPGIVLGHNDHIAWGATNIGADQQDLYLETFNNEGKYKTPAGWEMPKVRREEIRFRQNPLNPATEVEVLEVRETHNGVIVTEDGGKQFALKWMARDPRNIDFEAFYRLNRARDWNQFRAALKTYGGATQNFVYADVKGNIGWQGAGAVPIRKTGSGALPYDGATNDGEWTGYIPMDELPHRYNPAEGFLVTANQRTVGTDHKYFDVMTRSAATPWRAKRIYDLLRANKQISMDDVRDIQHDSYHFPLHTLAREIVKANAASPETLAHLRGWDGRMTADSKGATLANEIYECMARKIAAENSPLPIGAVRTLIVWRAVEQKLTRWLPKEYADYPTFFKACDAEARKSLADPKRLGADEANWVWGNLHKSNLSHPLAAAPFIGAQFATPKVSIDGSSQSPNVGSYVSMRLIASPGNWDATRHVIPLGQSGNPKSPFYKDQFEAWRTGTSAVFPFTPMAVEKSAREIITFVPQK
jgi:penicillin G amidase